MFTIANLQWKFFRFLKGGSSIQWVTNATVMRCSSTNGLSSPVLNMGIFFSFDFYSVNLKAYEEENFHVFPSLKTRLVWRGGGWRESTVSHWPLRGSALFSPWTPAPHFLAFPRKALGSHVSSFAVGISISTWWSHLHPTACSGLLCTSEKREASWSLILMESDSTNCCWPLKVVQGLFSLKRHYRVSRLAFWFNKQSNLFLTSVCYRDGQWGREEGVTDIRALC